MKKLFRLLFITSATFTAGCSLVYKIDVHQGNVITQDMLTQLEPGMDKAKVRFIMGTPLVMDAFHQDRWDYIYTFQKGDERREQQRVILHFNDDRLVNIEGNVKPVPGEVARKRHREITVNVPGEVKPGLIGWLKSSIGLGDEQETRDGDSTGRQEKKKATEEKHAQVTASAPASPEVAKQKEGNAKEEQSFFSQVMKELERSNKEVGPGRAGVGPEVVDSMEELSPLDPPN